LAGSITRKWETIQKITETFIHNIYKGTRAERRLRDTESIVKIVKRPFDNFYDTPFGRKRSKKRRDGGW